METFLKHIEENNLADLIEPIQGYSFDFFKNFQCKLDLVFIDGEHHYESVLKDYCGWSPLIKPGGIIIFHDYHAGAHEHDGPKRVIEEYIINNSYWINQRVVDRLYIATKRD